MGHIGLEATTMLFGVRLVGENAARDLLRRSARLREIGGEISARQWHLGLRALDVEPKRVR